MSGIRLAVAIVVMGLVVPATLFFLFRLSTPIQFAELATCCFFGWCVADVLGNVLSRPRLRDRTPGAALNDWRGKRDQG